MRTALSDCCLCYLVLDLFLLLVSLGNSLAHSWASLCVGLVSISTWMPRTSPSHCALAEVLPFFLRPLSWWESTGHHPKLFSSTLTHISSLRRSGWHHNQRPSWFFMAATFPAWSQSMPRFAWICAMASYSSHGFPGEQQQHMKMLPTSWGEK